MIDLQTFIGKHPDLVNCFEDIELAIEYMITSYSKGGALYVCGNGGSASDSLHIVGELQKSFNRTRKLTTDQGKLFKGLPNREFLVENLENGLRAYSLVSEVALITAISNDTGADLIFAQQVWACGEGNDVLLCLSTSGNSRNVVLAAETAKAKGMKVISLTGERLTSKLNAISDVCIKVPSTETYRIQEFHIQIYHFICLVLEEKFFK